MSVTAVNADNDLTQLTLYGARGSGSAAIEMALQAASIPYRLVHACSWDADSAYPELLGINPLGQIPTLLLPDGSVISESAAILIHLGLEHPRAGLLSADAATRALELRALVYIAANCYSAVSVSDFPQQWTTATGKAAHERVRSAARAQLGRRWEIFADSFAALLHGEPDAVAFLSVVVSQWSGARQHLQQARPDFHQALLRLEAHPRLAAVLAKDRIP